MSDALVEINEFDAEGDDIAFLKSLFVEYAESLSFPLCFQAFDEELASLPGRYDRPAGNMWLARVDGALAGCIAMRPDGACAEMKRLFVRPGFRGHRLGTRLTQTVLDYAQAQGYGTVRLDTAAAEMTEAQTIYRQLGFVECAPFYDNAPVELKFYHRDLTQPH